MASEVLFTETGVFVQYDIMSDTHDSVPVDVMACLFHGVFDRMFMKMPVDAEYPRGQTAHERVVMGDQQDRPLAAQFLEQLMELLVDDCIDIRCRFIKKEIGREPARARAMSTRCFCPPESA